MHRPRPSFPGTKFTLLAVSLAAAVVLSRVEAAGPEGIGGADRLTPRRTTVRNVELGYEFEYPDDLRFRKFPTLEGGGFMPADLGEIDPRGNEVVFYEVRWNQRPGRDFGTFLKEDVGSCDADGPSASRRCPPESIGVAKFRNEMEKDGYRIRRKRVEECFADNGMTTRLETDDLLIVYEIARRDGLAGAVVFSACEPRWIAKMLEIAGTYRRLPRAR